MTPVYFYPLAKSIRNDTIIVVVGSLIAHDCNIAGYCVRYANIAIFKYVYLRTTDTWLYCF